MGAYAPAPVATPQILSRIHDDILRPTIDGMRRDGLPLSSLSLLSIDALSGHPFVGLLFTGLILTPSGPKVLEYNVRFGDPETEALLLLLDDNTDFAAILHASLHHLSLSLLALFLLCPGLRSTPSRFRSHQLQTRLRRLRRPRLSRIPWPLSNRQTNFLFSLFLSLSVYSLTPHKSHLILS